ncbi:HPr family phosphocarrier protein [candidate division KSB3 bacterium]|jgi:phosphocarrier protein|uniref:HPr family phosphocarrier protein n=1 Tax=candidate division KSB3 bacterium TaxID=2044937 RepID=A0A9D5K074_9BACT|nr:HPr family phosphocarrier protein [candidate division KSB3 bacterium]MBD3327542.1 HPr family phosphocarrier protein [candidate division KSB3 bacterium]
MTEIRVAKIQNQLGLHARAAAQFVQTANKFQADVTVSKDGEDVNGKSVLSLMMLAAPLGSEITIKAEGDDAIEAINCLLELIENKFGEPK